MNNHLLSAAIGDICGSVYEHLSIKDYNGVDLRNPHHYYTDDTVCTFAVAEALMYDLDIAQTLRDRCREDINRDYGGQFLHWLLADGVEPPYNSFGNGSAMRVSAAGFMAKDEEECVRLATKTAEVTHNHPEGIKGAVATALVIFYAMHGKDKEFIHNNVLKKYYPNWYTLSYSAIKKDYCYDESCQRTVPAAIISFLESNSFEDCLKLAISLGGDADTLGAIAGPMAYGFYKEMPQELIDNAVNLLPAWILDINYAFDQHMNTKD
jgi:ADP-ribosylglycohydrolase